MNRKINPFTKCIRMYLYQCRYHRQITKYTQNLKYVNLNPKHIYVDTHKLRAAYIRYELSKNYDAKPYIELDDDLELGIVDTANNPMIATAVSSLLSRSIEDAKDINGGYIPASVVTHAQKNYVFLNTKKNHSHYISLEQQR